MDIQSFSQPPDVSLDHRGWSAHLVCVSGDPPAPYAHTKDGIKVLPNIA